ncbi:MAG: DoxX family membrane protein [Rhodothermales bacterium]|nr:DoxX family membrane protein [Rhodothermales bacterium]
MEKKFKLIGLTETHDDVALDLIRIVLGLALFVRGVLFMSDQSRVIAMVQQEDADWLVPIILIHGVTLVHIIGGLMLSAGLFTRLAALIQIPVLIVAVFLAFVQGGLLAPEQSLELAALVLILLCILFAFGAGTWSLDEVIFLRGSGIEAGEEITDEERQQRIKERVERQRREKLEEAERQRQRVAERTPVVHTPGPTAAEKRARTVLIVKYLVVALIGIVLFILGITNLPPGISVNELAAITGVVVFVFGAFALFYRSAFRD